MKIKNKILRTASTHAPGSDKAPRGTTPARLRTSDPRLGGALPCAHLLVVLDELVSQPSSRSGSRSSARQVTWQTR